MAAVIAGVRERPRIHIVLALSVLGDFALCLLHDNTGIHSVGPIHLSECVVPLGLLATAGILRGGGWLARAGVARTDIATGLAGYLAIACGVFTISNLASLHASAAARTAPARLVAELGIHHAIIVAEPFIMLPQVDPASAPASTWELRYPHPDPFLRDDVIYVEPVVPLADLRARFPDRAFYAMTYKVDPGHPTIKVTPIPP
jgi:hypothetical protein